MTEQPDAEEAVSTGADPSTVGPYLARVLEDDRWSGCRVSLISGGKSNLTYTVSSAAGEVVLRRPPLSSVLPTAHDMVREATVMGALRDTPVPVPDILHLCRDEDVLGARFYVMSKVDGPVVRGPEEMPAGYADDPTQRRAIGEGLVDVLAALHAVDYREVGLGDFGRPDGYLDRQLRRWKQQGEWSRTEPRPAIEELIEGLAKAKPDSPPTTVVHGDYRLDNTVLSPTEPGRIDAVLDWEMSTLGDPLADVGLLLVYWAQADDPEGRTGAPVASATVLQGFPTRVEVARLYAERTGRSVDTLPWYLAFGFFKLAVVVEGIVARVRAGAMLGSGFEGIEERIEPLVELGRAALEQGELT